jgi:hypothetical protein
MQKGFRAGASAWPALRALASRADAQSKTGEWPEHDFGRGRPSVVRQRQRAWSAQPSGISGKLRRSSRDRLVPDSAGATR